MSAVDSPMAQNGEMFGKVEHEVVGYHGSTGEEIGGHPSLLEVVSVGFVREHVEKEFASGFEEGVDFG